MDVLDAIEQMLTTSGQTKAGVSKAIGKHRNWLSTTVYKRSVCQTDTLARIAEAMGYKLILEGHGQRLELDPRPDSPKAQRREQTQL